MDLPPRIYLAGPAYSGKTTLAQLFEPLGYRHINYADGVKDELCRLAEITRAELEANKGYYRPSLQRLGAEARRWRPDHWIELREAKADAYSLTICSDLRYPNEAEDACKRGGLIVRVRVDDHVRNRRMLAAMGRTMTVEERSHESEQPLPDAMIDFEMYGDCPEAAALDVFRLRFAAFGAAWRDQNVYHLAN